MLESFFERWAARRQPRFRVFIEAKGAYESYVQDLGVRFDEMTAEHYDRAKVDVRLKAAERGFETAIAMCEADQALADAAVAKYQLGMVGHVQGRLEDSRALMHSALEVFSNLPHRDRGADMSGCYYHLGIIALKQGKASEATQELSRSRQMDEANGDFAGVHLCELALAKCSEESAGTGTSGLAPPDEPNDWERQQNVDSSVAEDSQPDSSRPPDYRSYDVRQLIWIGSYTVEANDRLMAHLESLGNEFGRPVSFGRAAFGAANPSKRKLEPPESDQHLCATILVIERAGLTDRAFRDLAASSMGWVVSAPDLRLLVYLHDLTIEQLREMADDDPLIAALFDTTQIAEVPSLEQLRRELVPYIHSVEFLRAKAAWRTYRLRCARLCGWLATIFLSLAACIAILGFPACLVNARLSWVGPYGPEIASFVFGVLAFPLQSPLIFMMLRGLRTSALAPRDNSHFTRWVCVGFMITLGAAHLRQSMHGPASYLFLGLVFGVLLDVIRRAGRRAWRQTINVEELMADASDSAWRDPGTTIAGGDPLKPFSCPLLPPLTPRIFISYTRSSAKGSRLADSLYQGMKATGAIPYLDRASNPTGASWRRSLNEQLGDCDAFVCILDAKSIQRPWVAAELLSALKSNRSLGIPDIFILMDPALKRSARGCIPIFQGFIAAAEGPPVVGRPQILVLNDQTQSSLTWALAPGRFMPISVFSRVAAVPIMSILMALGAVGSLGLLAGLILGFFSVLELMAKFPLMAQAVNHGWTNYLIGLAAFWLGFTARAAIAWGHEREQQSSGGRTMPAIATCGLAFSLICFYGRTSVLVAGWSFALAILGWVIVASAISSGVKGVAERTKSQNV